MEYQIINGSKKIRNVELDGLTEKGSKIKWNGVDYRVNEIVIKEPNSTIQLICKEDVKKSKFMGTRPRNVI